MEIMQFVNSTSIQSSMICQEQLATLIQHNAWGGDFSLRCRRVLEMLWLVSSTMMMKMMCGISSTSMRKKVSQIVSRGLLEAAAAKKGRRLFFRVVVAVYFCDLPPLSSSCVRLLERYTYSRKYLQPLSTENTIVIVGRLSNVAVESSVQYQK